MLRRKSVKWLIIISALVALLFSLSACDKTGDNLPDTTGETSETTEETVIESVETETQETTMEMTTTEEIMKHPYPEFHEISWLTGMGARYYEGAWDEFLLEEKYNVDFKIWNIHHTDTIGLSKMLAAGDIPDVGLLTGSPLSPAALYELEFTRSVPLKLIKEYFPYYYDKMLQNRPTGFVYNRIGGSEEYYGLSTIDNTYLQYTYVPLMRLDWLENIGHGIPEDYLTPITMTDEKFGRYDGQLYITNYYFEHESLNEIFRAFTEDDPDKNGRDDTFAAVIWPHTWKDPRADLYWGQFGIITSDPNFLYRDELSGDVVPYYAHMGYRDYMKWANRMRDKGYMKTVPEGESSDVLLKTWMKGKIGYFNANKNAICNPNLTESGDLNPPQSIWVNSNEDAVFVILPALKGPYKSLGTKRSEMDAMSDEIGRVFTFGTTVSDEKLARVFTIWNDYCSDPYNSFNDMLFAGIEGIHYKWSGDPYNSTRVVMPEDQVPNKYRMGKFWVGDFFGEENFFGYEAQRQILSFQYNGKWVKKYCIEPYKYIHVMDMGAKMYETYLADYAKVSEGIEAVVDDFARRVWKGQIKDINGAWNAYMDQLYMAGLRSMIDQYYNKKEFSSYKLPDFNAAISGFKGLK